jgi:hypothetical protein
VSTHMFDAVCVCSGWAVQLESMKPVMKAPGHERLKLKHDILHSSFPFKLNLRHYAAATWRRPTCCPCPAGAYTRPR